jgi:hypothetical protein
MQCGLLSVQCFFTCAHFCPTYSEVTLPCQNFTFMQSSDDREMRGKSREIWCAYYLLSIILCCIYWHPSIMCVLCIDCILVLTVASSSMLTRLAICSWLYSLHFFCSYCGLLHSTGFPCCTHRLLVHIVAFLLLYLAPPVADISTATDMWKWQSYRNELQRTK